MDSHPSWYLSHYAQTMLRDTGADMEPIYISSVKGDETVLEEGGFTTLIIPPHKWGRKEV